MSSSSTAPHPIIESLVQGLIELPKGSTDGRFVLSEEGAQTLEQSLNSLTSQAQAFRSAVENLWMFATYAQEQLASPQLASALIELMAAHPEVRRVAADVKRAEGAEKMGSLSEQFNKFTHAQNLHEEEIKTDEPKVSARDLLRNLGMNG